MPTAVTRTIRKDGMGDYTTFAAMIAELPADFTTYDEDWTVTVADSEEYAENIAIAAVMDATRNLTIQAADGQHPTVKTTAATGVSITGGYTTWQGVDVRAADATTAMALPSGASVARDCTIRPTSGRLGTGITTAGYTGGVALERVGIQGAIIGVSLNGAGTLQNIVVRDVTSVGVAFNSAAGTPELLHSTVDVIAEGACIQIQAGTVAGTIKSCILRAADVAVSWCIRQVDVAPYTSTSDHNSLTPQSGFVGRIGATEYATIATWQVASGDDANSDDAEPPWVDATTFNYALTESLNGEAALGVTDDFIEMGRFDPGDRGAFEYVPTLLMPS